MPKAKKAAKEIPDALRPPVGMKDVLPADQPYFDRVSRVVRELSEFYGFRKVDTPLVERAALYEKGVGADTDIIEKELYALKTKDAETLVLRPEGTVGIARAYLAHSMSRAGSPQKIWYQGPMFRNGPARFGSLRQFTQAGLEILGGGADPIYDAQIIVAFAALFSDLKLKGAALHVNSVGCRVCKPLYRKQLQNFIRGKEKSLCEDCDRKGKTNPLRIFDCKKKECGELFAHAPNFLDKICAGCSQHLKTVLEYLDETGVAYILDNKLVRGLDYYNRTVFEFVFEEGKAADLGSLAGGGRYDYLTETLGGKSTPSVGGSAGVERIIDAMHLLDIVPVEKTSRRVFVAHAGDLAKKKALKLIESLRAAGIPVLEALSRESLKAQLKAAEKDGIAVAVILGQREVYEGSIIIRDLKGGLQETFPSHRMVDEVKKRLRADS